MVMLGGQLRHDLSLKLLMLGQLVVVVHVIPGFGNFPSVGRVLLLWLGGGGVEVVARLSRVLPSNLRLSCRLLGSLLLL